MTEYTLGYWAIRGKGQGPRLLLAYTGLKFQEKQYTTPESWFTGDKDKLGLPFPNLPYLIAGDFKLTESSAIARYIANVGKP
jgi:glutathione S-transferase